MRNYHNLPTATGRATSYEGGVAYTMTNEEKFLELMTVGMLNGAFYTKQEDAIRDAGQLCLTALQHFPEFATQCAIHGSAMGMKLMPTIWLAYLSTMENKALFQFAFPKVIHNPGQLWNFMELVRKGNIRKGMGRAIKKTMTVWLQNHLTDYQVSRNKGKLGDVIKVVHPQCSDEEFQKWMVYIIKDELTFPRAAALDEVRKSLREGHYGEAERAKVRQFKLQLEELKSAFGPMAEETKQTLYMDMYQGLNYAALMLNLVALERTYAVRTRQVQRQSRERGVYMTTEVVETAIPQKVIQMVCTRISDVEAYRRSRILPFTLMNAERMVITPEFRVAINNLFAIVAEEAFNIPKDTEIMVAVDTSGSMSWPENQPNEHLTAADVACHMGAMIRKSHPSTELVAVATWARQISCYTQQSVSEMASAIRYTNAGGGTELHKLMEYYHGQKYVILMTDNEQAGNLEAAWLRAKRPKGAKLIVWQISAPYGVKISRDPSVINLSGYSDSILGAIKTIIEGGLDQMETVKQIPLA